MGIKSAIKNNRTLKGVIAPAYRFVKNAKDISLYNKVFKINSERVAKLDNEGRKKVWYFCVPVHPNLGDQAQACCISKWLKENYGDDEIVEILHNGSNYYDNCFTDCLDNKLFKMIEKKIGPNDVLFFQSGYTMTDVHPYQKTYLRIVSKFPNNRVVFLPQTILYEKEEVARKVQTILNGHTNLLLLSRDKVSFEIAEKLFSRCKCVLYPDIVTSQIGRYKFDNQRDGVLLCMRNDSEQYYSKDEVKRLSDKLSKKQSVELTDTTFNFNCLKSHEEMWKFVLGIIEHYAEKKVIITDRYHGTIFSLIANTPVIVVQTTDHKVSTGVDWFRGIYDGAIYFAETLDKAYELAEVIINSGATIDNKPYFDDQYYKKLKSLVERP